MSDGSDIHAKLPRSVWRRPVQVKFGKLATALGKGAIATAFGNWPGVAGSGVNTINALGLKPQDVGAIAWMLFICRSSAMPTCEGLH